MTTSSEQTTTRESGKDAVTEALIKGLIGTALHPKPGKWKDDVLAVSLADALMASLIPTKRTALQESSLEIVILAQALAPTLAQALAPVLAETLAPAIEQALRNIISTPEGGQQPSYQQGTSGQQPSYQRAAGEQEQATQTGSSEQERQHEHS
jgi:hypothetical protein